MRWEKQGHIFVPDGQAEWMMHYTSPLTTLVLADRFRVFFSTRGLLDEKGNYETKITFVDLDRENPTHVLDVHVKPILELGEVGTFDEHGTMVAEVVPVQDQIFMYYMGWQRAVSNPYTIRLGLAVSRDGIRFQKFSPGPVIGLSPSVPYGIGNVSVRQVGDEWVMWYTHFTAWHRAGNRYSPQYDLRRASSSDGIQWTFHGSVIEPAFPGEALATPSVLIRDGVYHMWFSHRSSEDYAAGNGSYRIGYARSEDGEHWQRQPEGGVDVSSAGWDQEMTCYPDVHEVDGQLLMFYCGNGFGRSGFGWALAYED